MDFLTAAVDVLDRVRVAFPSVTDLDPSSAQHTQIPGTLPTYQKAHQTLDTMGAPAGKTLDYGAGRGRSSTELGFDTFEPYPRADFQPTYSRSTDIPDASYHRVMNLNVLNVVPPDLRGQIVKEVGRVLAPGGHAVFTTRGWKGDVERSRPHPDYEQPTEPGAVITGRPPRYQKGFTRQELTDYIQHQLGDEYQVHPVPLGPAGVVAVRNGGARPQASVHFLAAAADVLEKAKAVDISPAFAPGPWLTVDDNNDFDMGAGEMFVPHPGFKVDPEGRGGWAHGVPQDTGPEDQAERMWRQVKYNPKEKRFYHPDTGEDVGEYEWGHFRPDRKMFVSAIMALARATLILAAPPAAGVQFNPMLTQQPLRGPRGPRTPSLDPERDPMGKLNNVGYSYDDMVHNLVSHYHGANDDERKQGRLWYKAAHDLFHKLAADRGISPQRAVAMGAAFSPNTDWGDNIRHASDFMMNYHPESPSHDERDWKMAHINPTALATFREQAGRDPSDSDEDLNQLADLHQGMFKQGPKLSQQNDLSNPQARANWIDLIQHHGMDKVLADHATQVFANKANAKRGKPYNPQDAMRDSGIKTLGGNIAKAKALSQVPDDPQAFYDVLGGPKISHFSNNILDDTPIDEEGYYQHPNGDWTQNPDLGGTIDSHHLKAASMPHGGWVRKLYHGGADNLDASNPYTYDVFNRGLLDATRQINAAEPDSAKHLTPKQVQAIIWLKHKNDNAFFGKGGLNAQSEADAGTHRVAALSPGEFEEMPPLWRKMFMSRRPAEWTDLLRAWVNHHTGGSFDPPTPPAEGGSSVRDACALLAKVSVLGIRT